MIRRQPRLADPSAASVRSFLRTAAPNAVDRLEEGDQRSSKTFGAAHKAWAMRLTAQGKEWEEVPSIRSGPQKPQNQLPARSSPAACVRTRPWSPVRAGPPDGPTCYGMSGPLRMFQLGRAPTRRYANQAENGDGSCIFLSMMRQDTGGPGATVRALFQARRPSPS